MTDEELDKALSEEFDKLEAKNQTEVPEEDADDNPDAGGDTEEAEDTEDGAEDSEDKPEEEEELDPALSVAPKSWTPEAKTKYTELPTWAKKEAHKRETDVEKGITSLKEQADFSRRLSETVKPYKQFLESNRIPLENAVRDAIDLSYRLRNGTPQQRGQILKSLAAEYKADLTVELDKNAQQLEPLYREINQLKQQLASSSSQSQEAKQQEINNQIDSFEKEVDDKGNPKHLYFANVRERMGKLISIGEATTLQDAYEKACWATPEIRSLILAQQRQEDEQERQHKAKQQADKLRKANNVVPNQRGGHDTAPESGSLDETLSQVYDKLVGQN